MRSLGALLLVGSVLGCVSARHQEAREAHVEKVCTHPRDPYVTGYSRGLSREPMDTSWADPSCQSDVRAWARYLSGYQTSIQHPSQELVDFTAGYGTPSRDDPTARYAPAYAFAQTCQASSDCGDHMSCRPREDGARVCMGNGSPGEACWFGSDCLSNSCELQDGIKVCR